MKIGEVATIGEFTGEVINIVGDSVYLRLDNEALVRCKLAQAPPPADSPDDAPDDTQEDHDV